MGRWIVMPRGRPCPACGATVSRLDDRCPVCDAKFDPQKPWYIYLVGAILVGLLFIGLGDFAALGRFIQGFIDLIAGILQSVRRD